MSFLIWTRVFVIYIAWGALGGAFRVHKKTSKVRRFNDWIILCGLLCNISVFSKCQWCCLVTDVITSLSCTGGEAEGWKPSVLNDSRGQTWSVCIWFFQAASCFILFYSLGRVLWLWFANYESLKLLQIRAHCLWLVIHKKRNPNLVGTCENSHLSNFPSSPENGDQRWLEAFFTRRSCFPSSIWWDHAFSPSAPAPFTASLAASEIKASVLRTTGPETVEGK